MFIYTPLYPFLPVSSWSKKRQGEIEETSVGRGVRHIWTKIDSRCVYTTLMFARIRRNVRNSRKEVVHQTRIVSFIDCRSTKPGGKKIQNIFFNALFVAFFIDVITTLKPRLFLFLPRLKYV